MLHIHTYIPPIFFFFIVVGYILTRSALIFFFNTVPDTWHDSGMNLEVNSEGQTHLPSLQGQNSASSKFSPWNIMIHVQASQLSGIYPATLVLAHFTNTEFFIFWKTIEYI